MVWDISDVWKRRMGIVLTSKGDRCKRINLLGTEKIIKTWKGGNSHVKYEKEQDKQPFMSV